MARSSTKKSTIVRTVVRAAFRTGGLVAPGPTARAAERLWFRLPARVPVGTALPVDGGVGELLGAPFEVLLHGRVVRGWVWGEGPVVYLVHGWGGSLEQMTPFVAPLLSRGLRVVAFDGPSHGRSDPGAHGPRSSDAVELGRALDAVAARFGPARAVVAHSMGALSTLLALRDGWLGTERLVLVAPVTGVPDLLARLAEDLPLTPRAGRRLVERARHRTGYAPADLDVLALAGQVDAARLLVVHDLGDRETPHAGSVRLARSLAGAHLLSTVGLGHNRVLADTSVTGAVARFVDRMPVEASLHGDDAPEPFPTPAVTSPAVVA